MSPDARSEYIRTEPTVHPRQDYLIDRLKGPLPSGARELIIEAIESYDRLNEFNFEPSDEVVGSDFVGNITDYYTPNALAEGRDKIITARYDNEGEFNERDIFNYVMVTVHADGPLEGSNIYPDFVRFLPVDSKGNSSDARFLLEVGNEVEAGSSKMSIKAFNGVVMSANIELTLELGNPQG